MLFDKKKNLDLSFWASISKPTAIANWVLDYPQATDFERTFSPHFIYLGRAGANILLELGNELSFPTLYLLGKW